MTAPGFLSSQFDQALSYVAQLHRFQQRKVNGAPYLGHLLGVAALVIEHGGGEVDAIAALLHDAVEDQGGDLILGEIQQWFGPEVAAVVRDCTEPPRLVDQSWHDHKLAYLTQVAQASAAAQRVVLADKLHNGYSLLGNLHRRQHLVWSEFPGGAVGVLWLYRTYGTELSRLQPGWMAMELLRVTEALADWANRRPREAGL